MYGDSKLLRPHLVRKTLERVRLSSGIKSKEWSEILKVGKKNYRKVLDGRLRISEKSWSNLASRFNVHPEDLMRGRIDYKNVFKASSPKIKVFPERYTVAMFGRRRTTITSLDFVEKRSGWRVRQDLLRNAGVSEELLEDPMGPISMQFITDLCAYLSRKWGYRANDFFDMGAYSAEGNRNTLLAQRYERSRSPSEVYELMFGEMLKFYEQNCTYSLIHLKNGLALATVRSNPDIAGALRVRHLGNEAICHLKAGWMSSAMDYLGLPRASVREVTCAHKGDSLCTYSLDFEAALNQHTARVRH